MVTTDTEKVTSFTVTDLLLCLLSVCSDEELQEDAPRRASVAGEGVSYNRGECSVGCASCSIWRNPNRIRGTQF